MAQFDINTATVEECKALAYDILGNIKRLQNDLSALDQAIAEKSKVVKEETPKK